VVISRLGTNLAVLFFVNFEGVRNLILSIIVARISYCKDLKDGNYSQGRMHFSTGFPAVSQYIRQ
jgi:hypothetical protein